MKKLRAVTLIELLMVMIISTIVIGVCYFAYLIAYRQLGDYKKISLEVNEAVILNSLLHTDFSKSKQSKKTNDGILFKFDKDKTHQYQFNDNYILRRDKEVTDTFKMSPINLQYLFESAEQDKADSIIDEFLFEAKVLDNIEQFHYTKQYDAQTLMENAINQ